MPQPATAADEPLAIHGGKPVFPAGPPAWPLPDEDLAAALAAAYADGSWGRYEGPHLPRLQAALCEMNGVEFALACSSGTIAVELALRGLKIAAGDEVLLAGYDFAGNFRAIEAVGATPVLVDIDPRTWCLDINQIEPALGPSVRAVIVSHLHGGLVPMRELMSIAQRAGLAVIEDACQTPGGMIQGQPAGSWGDVGVLSFGGSKLLTAGRGGAVLTNRADVFQRIKVACERGNHAFPLSELQAAVLLPQLPKLAERNRRRQQNAARLIELCRDLPALKPLEIDREIGDAGFFKLPWLFDADQAGGCSRENWLAAMQAEGVAIDVGFRGFAGRSAHRCRRTGELPASHAAAAETVVLHHPVLLGEPAEIERLAAAFRKVTLGLGRAT